MWKEPMRPRRFVRSRFAIALSITLAGCGSAPKPPPETAQIDDKTQSEALRYMPLEPDTVFTYDTQSEGRSEHGLLIVQVSRPREGRADLRMGSKTERLQIERDGIAQVEGGYLLKAPFSVGNTWKSRSGTVRIVAIDEEVQVPAGHFTGCMRTVEEGRAAGHVRSVTSVLCAHVGLVSLEATGGSEDAPGRETAILKAFGPRVNLTSTDVTTTSEEVTKQPE